MNINLILTLTLSLSLSLSLTLTLTILSPVVNANPNLNWRLSGDSSVSFGKMDALLNTVPEVSNPNTNLKLQT